MEATLDLTFSDSGGAPLNILTPIELSVFSVCAAAPAGDYNITVGFFGDGFSAAIIDTFLTAASTRETLVTADLTDQVVTTTDFSPTTGGDNDCFSDGEGPLREAFAVDDLHIDARVPAIDGPFGTLGSAGPCFTRSSVDADDSLPYYGDMRFDSTDMDRLLTDGLLLTTILHEMLHVLGIGTLWDTFGFVSFTSADVPAATCRLSTAFTDPPVYTGPGASGFYDTTLLGGAPEDVPVEDAGGSGTQCGHWDEQRFNTALMTGHIDSTAPNELTGLTGNSLANMDYTVDLSKVDPYVIPPCGLTAPPSCVTTDLVAGPSYNAIAGEMIHGPMVRNTADGGIEIFGPLGR